MNEKENRYRGNVPLKKGNGSDSKKLTVSGNIKSSSILPLMARFQSLVISLKVVSRDNNDANMCLTSSSVQTPTAFGMILAVFSLVILVTDLTGIWSCN